MREYDTSHFTFEGLDSLKGPTGGPDTVGYMLGLVDSAKHPIGDPLVARRIITHLFDIEEQASHGADLREREKAFCARFFSGGYEVQTPCMLTKRWSPIAAMLNFRLNPTLLQRESRARATATGIWAPTQINTAAAMDSDGVFGEQFWPILKEAFARADRRRMCVNVIVCPGWNYDTKVDSLPPWSSEEVARAGRILWKRTPDD